MDTDPSNEELHAFVGSLLSNFKQLVSDDGVIEQAIGEHREMWVLLYRASQGFTIPDA